MPKTFKLPHNCTIAHTIKKCSKFSKPGFYSILTVSFQLFKVDFEKAEEPEVRLSTSVRSSKKGREFQENTYFCLLTIPKLLTVWVTTNCGKVLDMEIPNYLTYLLRNLCAGQETTFRTGPGKKKKELDLEQQTGSKLGKKYIRLYIVTLLI